MGAIGFGSERRSGLARADVRSPRGAARDVDRAAAARAGRFPRFRRCEPARLPVGDRHQLCATLVPGANRHRQSRCRGIHRRDRRRAAVEHPGRERPDMVAAARDRRQRQREGGAEWLRGLVPDRQPDAVRLRDQCRGAVREVRFRSPRTVARSDRLRTDIVQRQVRRRSRGRASLRLVVRVPAATVGERLACGRAGRAGCRREHRAAAFPDGQRREPGRVGGAAQCRHGAGRRDVWMAKAPGGCRSRSPRPARRCRTADSLCRRAGLRGRMVHHGEARGRGGYGTPWRHRLDAVLLRVLLALPGDDVQRHRLHSAVCAGRAAVLAVGSASRPHSSLACRVGCDADRQHRRDEQGISCRPAARLYGRLLCRSVGDAGACRPAVRLAIVAFAATGVFGSAGGRCASTAGCGACDRICIRFGCRERRCPTGGPAAGRRRGSHGDRVPGCIVGARGWDCSCMPRPCCAIRRRRT